MTSVTAIVHPFFQANAWLVANDTHAILLDTASNESADAQRAIDAIAKSGRTLQATVLTHGHPDIWLGVKRLREQYPSTPIYVAQACILDDIIAMGNLLEQYGMLAKTPELAPARYDYRAAIQVLASDTLVLAGSTPLALRMHVTEQPSEYTHITTIEIPELDAVFVSDLAYNHVHSWAGMGVDRAAIVNWLALVDRLIGRHGRPDVRVFCGHGPETDANVLYTQRDYLRALLEAIDGGGDDAAVKARMVERFPAFAGAGFQLAMTVQNRAALQQR